MRYPQTTSRKSVRSLTQQNKHKPRASMKEEAPQIFHHRIYQANISNRTLSDATTLGQSGPGSDVNKGELCIPVASPSDCLVSYLGHSLGETSSPAEMQSMYSIASADWALFRTDSAIPVNTSSSSSSSYPALASQCHNHHPPPHHLHHHQLLLDFINNYFYSYCFNYCYNSNTAFFTPSYHPALFTHPPHYKLHSSFFMNEWKKSQMITGEKIGVSCTLPTIPSVDLADFAMINSNKR